MGINGKQKWALSDKVYENKARISLKWQTQLFWWDPLNGWGNLDDYLQQGSWALYDLTAFEFSRTSYNMNEMVTWSNRHQMMPLIELTC
jgi:hypothetical protein